MATIRSGTGTALVIVDVQAGVVARAVDCARTIQNIVLTIDRARQAGIPVIWVQHNDQEPVRDSAAWQLVPEMTPRPGDHQVHKNFNSAFEATGLEDVLCRLGVTRIVLAGAATNWCIRATAYAALERGYDLMLVSDAHLTESIERADGRVIEARDIVAEMNATMPWLSYPGRACAAAAAADVEFAALP